MRFLGGFVSYYDGWDECEYGTSGAIFFKGSGA